MLSKCLSDRAGVGSLELLGTSGAMDKESSDLDLAGGIEGDEADVGTGESLGASLDLLDNLGAISASEHGELPHGPVAVVLVSGRSTLETDASLVTDISVLGLRELEAGGESIADHVVYLAGDLAIRERGKERESLEEPEINWGGR